MINIQQAQLQEKIVLNALLVIVIVFHEDK